MLPFFFASPLAMELLKVYFRRQASHDSDAKAPANEGARAVEPSLE
jgi:hypothetical protein